MHSLHEVISFIMMLAKVKLNFLLINHSVKLSHTLGHASQQATFGSYSTFLTCCYLMD